MTPEEVVCPMVEMLLSSIDSSDLARIGKTGQHLYGDICGGTGRFVYAIARKLLVLGYPKRQVERAARLFDQSSLTPNWD